jgi:nitronate monooxygenase
MRDLGAIRSDIPLFPHASAAITPLRAAAEVTGRGDFSPLWSGQNSGGCRASAAAELTRNLAR